MDYKSSGVDIDAGNRAVDQIKSHVAKTFSPQVLNPLGGFAGGFALPTGYTEPVLVSCTDGVGTKLKLAIDSGRFNTVGIDLVAMCVNDMICSGAKPLFFLDYIACHALNPDQVEQLIAGMVEGCLQAGCALTGGEMAEMNDLYRPGDFDLAGFSVGVVEKSEMITGQSIKAGNYVYGLPSSGVHSNGYSLLRKVLTPDVCESRGISMETLLEPTKIYVKEVLELIQAGGVTGVVHITGGGMAENIMRVLPDSGVSVSIDSSSWEAPEVFTHIQEAGNISTDEMRRVFNMGIGMVIFSDRPLDGLLEIGTVESSQSPESIVQVN